MNDPGLRGADLRALQPVALGYSALVRLGDEAPSFLEFSQCPCQKLIPDLFDLQRPFGSRRIALGNRRDHLAQLSAR